MKTFSTNKFAICARVFGGMLIVALMVPVVIFSQPTLISPADVASGISTSPTLSWSAAAGDTLYRLQISALNDFSTMVYDDATLTSASNTVTGLVNSTQYYWRVNVKVDAANGGGTSAFSAFRTFTTWVSTPSPSPVLLPVTLGLTSGFAALSYAGITNTGASAITGNIGVSPTTGTSITGFGTVDLAGNIYVVGPAGPTGYITFPSMLTTAMGDLTIAYNDAAGRTVNPIGIAGNIGGRTLYSGLYKSTGTLEITSGDLTLDAQGDVNAVWIFQIASSFNMTSGRQVFLSGGAKASNIFWQVGTLASFGTTCVMKGTILAGTACTFATGATLEGRALAKTANVTLQGNTIGGSMTSPLHAVFLGTAANFRILAGTAITVGAGNIVTGDIGLSPAPGSAITVSGSITGTIYKTDATGPAGTVDASMLTTAKVDLDTAYNIAARQIPDSTLSTNELGARTLTAGVYKSAAGTFAISTDTLKLHGNMNDVFIFKMTTSLTTGASSVVTLTGGALMSNVFWQVGSSATIDGEFKGNILALTAITQNTDTIDGRALARNSFVTVNGTALLPVVLVSFIASGNQKNADLHWSTATEVNNFGFEVQRSAVGNQHSEMNWAKVGFVDGNGTTNASKAYSFTDNNLSSGKYSYRLKQIDRDGKFTYSQSVEVTIGQTPKEFALMQNYPNPFNPTTMISYQIPAGNTVSLKVFDAIGREVATLLNETKDAGSYSVNFDASKLSSGVYIYRLESGSFVSTKKLILMK